MFGEDTVLDLAWNCDLGMECDLGVAYRCCSAVDVECRRRCLFVWRPDSKHFYASAAWVLSRGSAAPAVPSLLAGRSRPMTYRSHGYALRAAVPVRRLRVRHSGCSRLRRNSRLVVN